MKTSPLRLAILLMVPFIAAPYFPACTEPTHGVSPTFCDWRAGCDDRTPEEIVTDAEDKMRVTEMTGALMLTVSDWSALDICVPATGTPPPGARIETNLAGQQFECVYNFDLVRAFLDAFVLDNATRGFGRGVTIQLAPIFTTRRTVPLYLADTPFSHQAMGDAFINLWEALENQVLNTTPYVEIPMRILVGNEVNFYLQNPEDVDGTPQAAWAGFRSFFDRVRDHIFFQGGFRISSVSTAYYGAAPWDGQCGLGDSAWLSCNQAIQDITALNSIVWFRTYTYYPKPSFSSSSIAALRALVTSDFNAMAATGGNLSVMIQEAGYPSSSLVDGNPDGILRQAHFVDAAFDAWTANQDEIRWFNYFALHDFSKAVNAGFAPCEEAVDCVEPSSTVGVVLECDENVGECVVPGTCIDPDGNDNGLCQEVSPFLQCCRNPATCLPDSLGKCVLPSACDIALVGLFAGALDGAPDCATDADCAIGTSCSSFNKCLSTSGRETVCSWGLYFADGNPKLSAFVYEQNSVAVNPPPF